MFFPAFCFPFLGTLWNPYFLHFSALLCGLGGPWKSSSSKFRASDLLVLCFEISGQLPTFQLFDFFRLFCLIFLVLRGAAISNTLVSGGYKLVAGV